MLNCIHHYLAAQKKAEEYKAQHKKNTVRKIKKERKDAKRKRSAGSDEQK